MSTIVEEIGPPMRIHRAATFALYGVRFRSSARTVLDLTGETVTLRIGRVGSARLIEQALSVDETDPLDPFSYATLSVEQTTIDAGAYEYVFVDSDGRVLLSGSATVVDHTRPAA